MNVTEMQSSTTEENQNRKGQNVATSSTEEGSLAKAIESQTSRLPSDVFLWSAMGAAATSAGLFLFGRKEASRFIGQWVPSLLIFGVYNKIVKVAGSDTTSSKRSGLSDRRNRSEESEREGQKNRSKAS